MALAVMSTAAFAAMAIAFALGWQPAGDAASAERMYNLVEDHRYSVDLLIDAGRTAGVALVLFVVLALIRLRRFAHAALVIAAVGGVVGIELFVKEAVRRPSLNLGDTGYSFPSGHAMAAVAVAVLLALLAAPGRRAVVGAAASAAAAGYGALIVSRGWHYPTDVVGGWLGAASWLSLLWLLAGAPIVRRHGRVDARTLLGRDRDRDRDAAR